MEHISFRKAVSSACLASHPLRSLVASQPIWPLPRTISLQHPCSPQTATIRLDPRQHTKSIGTRLHSQAAAPFPISSSSTQSTTSSSQTSPRIRTQKSPRPKPDPVTLTIDQISSIPPPRDLSARIKRVWRFSECLQSITIARTGRLATTNSESNKDQAEAIRLVRQRLEIDEGKAAQDGKEGGEQGDSQARWTVGKRRELRKAIREHNIFSVLIQGQLYAIIGGILLGMWWLIKPWFGRDQEAEEEDW